MFIYFFSERDAEAQRLRERAAELTSQLERMKRELVERDVTLATMRDEVTSVQARLVEKASKNKRKKEAQTVVTKFVFQEKRLLEVEQENSVLLERWINYKNTEAERLNQQNAILAKDPKVAHQEQQVRKRRKKENMSFFFEH